MLQVSAKDVQTDPFPHVLKQGILADDVFQALRADFPDREIFSGQSAAHGSAGSRTGSGFDIYRGDPAFNRLVERSKAWRDFAAYINSEAFADTFRSTFADHIHDIGLRVKLEESHVNPSHVEPREVLTETATVGDRIVLGINSVIHPLLKPKKTELFTRLDIHKSTGGYAKAAHCDRPNRLCSLIIYFTDAEAIGMEGGDLLIFKHKEKKSIDDYERHPRPHNVDQVAKIRPKANLGVFFPCQNNSYHGVTPVLSSGLERDFLYINISGRTRTVW